jgi:hypothetical protein
MALGKKTGGRVAGTPNRRTQDVIERLAALNCDPIEGMAKIAMDEANAPELRGRMFAELAQYVAPKRRAIDHSAAEGAGEFTVRWMNADARELPTADLVDRLLQDIAAGEVPAAEVPQLMDALRIQIAAR